MDYRNILATGFVILCGAVFVNAINSAKAFPQGPNVSTGSNPIENFYGNANTAGTINFQNDFIVTTLLSNSTNCDPQLNGLSFYTGSGTNNLFYYNFNNPTNSVFSTGNAQLKIEAGTTFTLVGCADYYISGYYAHP